MVCLSRQGSCAQRSTALGSSGIHWFITSRLHQSSLKLFCSALAFKPLLLKAAVSSCSSLFDEIRCIPVQIIYVGFFLFGFKRAVACFLFIPLIILAAPNIINAKPVIPTRANSVPDPPPYAIIKIK